jgi:hypothetical protein
MKKNSTRLAAACGYCGALIDCVKDSVVEKGYWQVSGLRICDVCLLKASDDFPNMKGDKRVWALRLRWNRGLNIDHILEVSKKVQPDLLSDELGKSFQRFVGGEKLASMDCAQAAWNMANHLHESIKNYPLVRDGKSLQKTRAIGTKNSAEAAKKKAEAWHTECTRSADELLRKGTAPRDLAGILSRKFGRSQSTIRRVLKKASMK